jgi:hypothetical protein
VPVTATLAADDAKSVNRQPDSYEFSVNENRLR